MSRNPKASVKQLEASDPRASAWVNANAGSGKTHVLVDRVIRLLLGGTEPSKIMCLTFTKAAAAEMSNRLFERLSLWVSLPGNLLTQALRELGANQVEPDLLRRARQLFTRALETPGGLKIQTIHAFCERVLQLFPVEAGIVPRFTVMDERTAKDVLKAARDQVLIAAQDAPGTVLGRAMADVAGRVQADDFEEIMRQLLFQRAALHDIFADAAGVDNAVRSIRQHLGLGDGESQAAVRSGLLLDRQKYRDFAEALASGSPGDVERSHKLMLELSESQPILMNLQSFFLTAKDEPRKAGGIATKPVVTAYPWITAFIADEQQRLRDALGKLADLERISASRSLLITGSEILRAFESAKRQQGAYDFDDLIIRTGELLSQRPDAAWVLYKLDGGIEHLLVDEAQDTSPAQWRIIEALTAEFFAGEGRHGANPRTIFAVGDRKQSIYSFQGADPDIFEVVHDAFEVRVAAAGQPFNDVDLTVSFRSAPEILTAVDAVFAKDKVARRGLDGRAERDWPHESNRRDARGLVELWPLIEPEDDAEQEPWTAPVDREPSRSPRRRLALKLARTIKSWIGKREIAALGRTVRPGDILVLVRARNGFFDALIRELRKEGVPVAGADRLRLMDNIAVLDLIAVARFCVMPEDDYSLACVLKSPVLVTPLNEEQLFAIAAARKSLPLWDALRRSADPVCTAAATQLGRLAAIAAAARPFEFFADILVGSRLRFLSRLGSEANDALDALLESALGYEAGHGSALAGFVNWFATGDAEIKRNMEQGSGEVRIMTVHGAKGLEAPIVILPDTVSMPDQRQQPPLMMIQTGNSGARIPFWPLTRQFVSDGVAALKATMKDQQAEEYRRLLYVAMTRARDELYVCGYGGKTGIRDDCWYNLVTDGLRPLMHEFGAGEGWRLGTGPVFRGGGQEAVLASLALPEWLDRGAADESVLQDPVAVSTLARSRVGSAPGPQAGDRIARGIVIHRILQQLPDLPESQRRDHAIRLAVKAGYGEDLADDLIALTRKPEFSRIFGRDGLSEIPLIAELPELGITVVGRIDRLVVSEAEILAVDYKTDRHCPASSDEVNPEYLRQMAAYREGLRRIHPGTPICSALLFTEAPSLLFIPDALLDHAFHHIPVSRP